MTDNLVKITESSTVVIEDTKTNTVIIKAAGPRGAQGDPGGSITVQDEGVDVGNISTYLNFTGDAVGVTDVGGVITVAVSAAASGANSDITSLSGITGGVSTPDYIDFDTGATVSRATGRLWWDNADGIATLNLGMAGSDVTQQVGEEIYFRIKASAAIAEGDVVMFTGTVGASGGLTGAPATGLTKSTASYVMGVATEAIALNGWGYVTQFGLVRNIDTSAFSDGDILYLDPTVAGGLTTTVPSSPAPKVEVAAVVYAAANGSLFVRPIARFELEQLNDVETTGASDTDLLQYNGTSGVWEHSPASSITVGNVSGTVAIANGGTGATTAADARENLLPSYTGNAGKLLAVNVGETDVEFVDAGGVGTVTSVAASVPTGFSISGSPITSSGTLAITFAAGYSLPTDASQTNWNTAYGWGDHAAAGYLTSETYTGTVTSVNATVPTGLTVTGGPITSSGTLAIGLDTGYAIPTSTQITQGTTAYSWGDHAAAGYLTSETYTGTVTSVAVTVPTGLTITGSPITSSGTLAIALDTGYTIPTSTQITQGTTAYGWGDHSTAGYLTSISSGDVTTALGYTPEDSADKGQPNGYASLDGSGLVPASQLPSYVDDVLEYASTASFPATGETGKIYVAIDTAKTYRWSGSAYVEISASPGSTDAVPEGSTNLYYTDARARSAISVSGSLAYDSGTGVISYTQPTNVSTFTNDAGYLTSETYTGTVTSVGLSVPTGFAITGSPITSSGTLALAFDTGYSLPTSASQTNWDTAYSWGDHSAAGYLTAETYTGTVTSVAMTVPTGLSIAGSPITSSGTLAVTFAAGYSIPTDASQANWNTAYGWGDHAAAGYLTSETYTGTVTSVGLSVPTGFAVTGSPITAAGTLALAFDTGYALPTTASQTNWDTAYGWGDHASAGYLTASSTIDGGTF